MPARFDAFFLPLRGGQRFCMLHMPAQAPRGAVLYVHPFAEEMNKARRAAAVCARALADDGCAVLQMDLLGCGDSSGDFGDASWDAWLDDVASGAAWLAERAGGPLVLWGLRAGCLLATAALPRLASAPHLLLWQPVASGKLFLTQFLRLRAAASMLSEQGTRTDTKVLREQLGAGASVQVAGYTLAPALALGLEKAELVLPANHAGRVLWCEVANAGAAPAAASLPPAATTRLQRWRDDGVRADAAVVEGLPFWQTQEIAECPPLIAASRAFVREVIG